MYDTFNKLCKELMICLIRSERPSERLLTEYEAYTTLMAKKGETSLLQPLKRIMRLIRS